MRTASESWEKALMRVAKNPVLLGEFVTRRDNRSNKLIELSGNDNFVYFDSKLFFEIFNMCRLNFYRFRIRESQFVKIYKNIILMSKNKLLEEINVKYRKILR